MQGIASAGGQSMIVKVYLSTNRVRDTAGVMHAFPQERLVKLRPEDRVLAVIDAPRGSRIRRRPDQHGSDQLLVPSQIRYFWDVWFCRKYTIPVKYLIHEARLGTHKLKLLEYYPQADADPPPKPTAPAPGHP